MHCIHLGVATAVHPISTSHLALVGHPDAAILARHWISTESAPTWWMEFHDVLLLEAGLNSPVIAVGVLTYILL